MKIVIKIIIITVSTIIGLPILFCVVLYCYSLYCNLNPSHVNLEKDGFEKIFSFITSKNKVTVEVYAKPGEKNISGKFVIVRKGVLPFGIKLVSTVISGYCYWIKPLPEMYSNITNKMIKFPPATEIFEGNLGFYYNFEINSNEFRKYWSQPSMHFSIKLNKFNNETTFNIECKFCEEIPVFQSLCWNIFNRDLEPYCENNKIQYLCFDCLHYRFSRNETDSTKIDSYKLYANLSDIFPIPIKEPK